MAKPPAPLRILEQPLQLFWKDRGGKRNQLRCVVESPLPVTQVRLTAGSVPAPRRNESSASQLPAPLAPLHAHSLASPLPARPAGDPAAADAVE